MGAIESVFRTGQDTGSGSQREFITGIQALVRLPMLQRQRDRVRGIATAGLISGYRGSPLGAYDQQLWKASQLLAEHDVVFQPGLNEDLAATALWGAQMHRAFGATKVDGVFGIWYGKGPGVDRTGDVFRTANMMGTSALGGVLAVSGDDHAAQSSMYPHHTDGIFQAASMPVLQPASVQEVIELGLAGIELSRFSGLWVALKTIAEVIETAATVDFNVFPVFVQPHDFVLPPHSLNWDPGIAWPAQRAELERRLIEARLPAARAWARANRLDHIVVDAPQRRLGLITVGKAHQDLMQAVRDLGLVEDDLATLGISIYKVAMSWPLETQGALAFAAGHDEVLVIEEKRANVETQLKDALFHCRAETRPRVCGKVDAHGAPLLPEVSEFNPRLVARVLLARMAETGIDAPRVRDRMVELEATARPVPAGVIPIRKPYFCSGCPHNSSTRTPDGSVSGGGIGCHVMALSQPDLKTSTFSQMGGEGAQWIGAAPFSQTPHIFQNLGDGTYQHSGLLAIRAAIAAGTHITYKILFNDAVAMTGGQPAEGAPDPLRITRQLREEGVARIALVSDDPTRWQAHADLAKGVEIFHRDALDAVQREFRAIPAVTAIVYEQTCAAEKRRRRKRGTMPDPDRRLYINQAVCEGCGDCSVQSNCIAVEPVETLLGRKRAINQSACNKDFSCTKGFCPSFVELDGARLRKPDTKALLSREDALLAQIAEPVIPSLEQPFNIYVTGIGGSGVLTMGALLGAAAHADGRAATVLDFTGLAQKNGAVVSQVRLARRDGDIPASRIGEGAVDLLLGADLVVSAAADTLTRLSAARTSAVVNLTVQPTADGVQDRDATLPVGLMQERVRKRCRAPDWHGFDASGAAQRLFGDTLPMHTLLLGYAWQKGLVPLSRSAIDSAIVANGAAVPLNQRAFNWGRILAEGGGTEEIADSSAMPKVLPQTLDHVIAHRVQELTAYQNAAYAQRYRDLVMLARRAEAAARPGSEDFAMAVAVNAYRLMAYKDEYEVARLYSGEAFRASLAAQFAFSRKMSLWLAPPLLSRTDPATGRPRKRRFGPWIFPALGLLARLRGLRGTAADVFGYTAERRAERALVAEYFDDIGKLVTKLTESYETALALAQLPQQVRGFGPVKEAAMDSHRKQREELMQRLTVN